jgi:hypothetical protein
MQELKELLMNDGCVFLRQKVTAGEFSCCHE